MLHRNWKNLKKVLKKLWYVEFATNCSISVSHSYLACISNIPLLCVIYCSSILNIFSWAAFVLAVFRTGVNEATTSAHSVEQKYLGSGKQFNGCVLMFFSSWYGKPKLCSSNSPCSKNHTICAIVESYLELNPEKARDPEELKDMDERCKITDEMVTTNSFLFDGALNNCLCIVPIASYVQRSPMEPRRRRRN